MEKAEAENKNEEAKTPKVIARKPQSVHKQSVINSFSLDKQIIPKKFDLKKGGGYFCVPHRGGSQHPPTS